MTPALTFSARALGYPRAAPVLCDFSFTVQAGQTLALLGGNGAGKTTILKSIVGLLKGTEAVSEVHGVKLTRSPADAVKAGMGLVFQNPDEQLFCSTVLEDVLYGPRNLGLSEQEAHERGNAAIECLGISHLVDRPIEALSFGEKKRVCLAAVLAMKPSILLLDEPTAGLDPQCELSFLKILEQLSRTMNVALIVATHAVDLVPYFADRVMLLGERQVLAEGTPHDVFDRGEDLLRARVRAPWVAQLWRTVHRNGEVSLPCALTVEEAARRWKKEQNVAVCEG